MCSIPVGPRIYFQERAPTSGRVPRPPRLQCGGGQYLIARSTSSIDLPPAATTAPTRPARGARNSVFCAALLCLAQRSLMPETCDVRPSALLIADARDGWRVPRPILSGHGQFCSIEIAFARTPTPLCPTRVQSSLHPHLLARSNLHACSKIQPVDGGFLCTHVVNAAAEAARRQCWFEGVALVLLPGARPKAGRPRSPACYEPGALHAGSRFTSPRPPGPWPGE